MRNNIKFYSRCIVLLAPPHINNEKHGSKSGCGEKSGLEGFKEGQWVERNAS